MWMGNSGKFYFEKNNSAIAGELRLWWESKWFHSSFFVSVFLIQHNINDDDDSMDEREFSFVIFSAFRSLASLDWRWTILSLMKNHQENVFFWNELWWRLRTKCEFIRIDTKWRHRWASLRAILLSIFIMRLWIENEQWNNFGRNWDFKCKKQTQPTSHAWFSIRTENILEENPLKKSFQRLFHISGELNNFQIPLNIHETWF